MTIMAVFMLRWLTRLAPLMNEAPLKTLIAGLLAAVVSLAGLTGSQVSTGLELSALVLAVLFVLLPLGAVALARSQRYHLADGLAQLLYWSPEGRQVFRRLFAQLALQHGDAEVVSRLIPERDADAVLLAQLYALQRKWPEILSLNLPEQGENRFLAYAARVEAYLALAWLEQAEQEIHTMKEYFEQEQSPLAYRSLVVSELRLAAERGQFASVRDKLQDPPVGVASYTLFGILARAAEQSNQLEVASRFYEQAYLSAPQPRQAQYALKLQALGQVLPETAKTRRGWSATVTLLIILLGAYGIQLWLERAYNPNVPGLLGGFLLNFPQVPESTALWRFLSYAFVHGNLLHIGFNAWVLFDIGRMYEARRNWGNLLTSFVLGTMMGAYLTQIAQANDQLVLVGASGGILGIAGALLADAWRGRGSQDRMLTRSLLQWMVLIVLLSLAIPNVSLWGHIGGVVGGLLWGFVRQGLPSSALLDRLLGSVASLLLCAAVAAMVMMFINHVL